MRPLREGGAIDVKIAASGPIACRLCGRADGLVVDMEPRGSVTAVLVGKSDLAVELPVQLYRCPRCGRHVLVEQVEGMPR